jgi:recombination protein RecT
MSSVRGAVATRQETQVSVGQFIQNLRPEIARALPKHMDADRIARLALTVLRTDQLAAEKRGKPQQALTRCKPESFAGALLTASALGLEPGVNGEAYLVAHAGECTLIVGYQGFAKLFWQHPLAQHLDAQAVHENDEFDYAYGLDPFLNHKPALGDRGKVIAYYAVAGLTSGARIFVVLSPEEVRALRGGKTGSNGGIADPMHWMERKTALRQLFKLLPKSPLLARAMDADEKTGSELRREMELEHTPSRTAITSTTPTTEPANRDPAAVDDATGEVLEVEVEDPPAGWDDVEVAKPADARA